VPLAEVHKNLDGPEDILQLHEIGTLLTPQGNLDSLYHRILDTATSLMSSDMASMQLFDSESNRLRLLAWKGFHPQSAIFWEWVYLDSASTCGLALSSGCRVVVPDIETCEFMAGTADLDEYRRSKIRAVQSTPLVSRSGQLLGMISTHWREPYQPVERNLLRLDVLARQAADLVERGKAEAALREKTPLPTSFHPDGEMSRLIREKDWSRTPIGSVEQWSPTLKTMANFLLANRFPLLLWWGPQYVSIYNDAYRPILGAKHPRAVGQPFREVWPEIEHILSPLIDTPFNGGPATWMDDILLEVNRHGYFEETHFTIAYSPVPDDTAPRGIGGVLATVHEITEKIVGERRIEALRDLGARAAEGRSAEEACCLAALALKNHAKDIPFALIYLVDVNGETAQLVATCGFAEGERLPSEIATVIVSKRIEAIWPLAEVIESGASILVEKLGSVMPKVPSGPWSDPPNTAIVVPIKSSVRRELTGFLVAGLSSRLRLDNQYRGFLDLIARQISGAIVNARAYEQERKRAEALAEIDRAKTIFFSNVSHEFRTPLSLILGPLTDALVDGKGLDLPQLNLLHRNSLRLLKLVNSLLDFSRIEARRAQATYDAVDLSQLTSELASNFRSACEHAGLNLLVRCEPLSAPVYVDRDMWEKIVLNLLSNAFKFTFAGEIEVLLREVDGYAELSVRDTGVGIPEVELPKLFERFHRIEGQKSRTHEGTGIGLALVLELVKLHAGTMQVESALDRGTTFIARIPFGSARLSIDETHARPSPLSTSIRADAFVQEALRWLPDGPEVEGSAVKEIDQPRDIVGLPAGSRVLLVDDNADMREYIRRLLSGSCQVRTVSDGLAALRDIREHRPNLVLADVMMPGLDGFELLRQIRADASISDIPVILISARSGEESRVEGLEAGADDYLIKPFSARELVARVKANLQLAHLRSAAIAAIRESEQRLRWLGSIVESSDDAIIGKNLDDIITSWNSGAERVFGYTAEEAIGRPITIVIPEDRQGEEREILARIRRGEHVHHYETVRRRKDGRLVDISLTVSPVKDVQDAIVGVSKIARDVTERKRNDEHIAILAREAEHRTKNILATVQATVNLSHSDTANDLKGAIEGRIQALTNVHSLFVESRWDGAELSSIVTQELAPYLGSRDPRAQIDGPHVRLPTNTAQAIAMTLHELATNAVKYGCLSVPEGHLCVKWAHATDGQLTLDWIESGGPPTKEPTREGFGMSVIKRLIRGEGEIHLDWRAEGLECAIVFQTSKR
jgi:PAS domain S-box-containing protein